jgi:hypothetical protein
MGSTPTGLPFEGTAHRGIEKFALITDHIKAAVFSPDEGTPLGLKDKHSLPPVSLGAMVVNPPWRIKYKSVVLKKD